MKILVIWLFLCGISLANEGYVTLTSADGQNTMQAKPVAVVDHPAGKICLEKMNGDQVLADPKKFSDAEVNNPASKVPEAAHLASVAAVARLKPLPYPLP